MDKLKMMDTIKRVYATGGNVTEIKFQFIPRKCCTNRGTGKVSRERKGRDIKKGTKILCQNKENFDKFSFLSN